jgi:5-oxopent-3-ene-1,2,5-tricarboxylate decarboxylase/2-hydroxyhepta-2,4-diene-1,7-dioate isomerase
VVEASAVLAICFARDARSVLAEDVFDYVAGFTLAIDLTEPGDDFFRPPIREKCRDGFLPIGPSIVPRSSIADLERISVSLEIDGTQVASFGLQDRIPAIARLIEQMSEFMTLRTGDVLLATRTLPGTTGSIGSKILATSDQLGNLQCTLEGEKEVTG